MKQWEPDWLSKAIAKIEAAPPRRPADMNKKVVQARRLDRRLSPTTIAELVEAYETGTSTPVLCQRYGLSKGGVLKLLHGAGVEMRRRGLSEQQVQLAQQLHDEGSSYAEIGQRIGKAKSSVREALRAVGSQPTAAK